MVYEFRQPYEHFVGIWLVEIHCQAFTPAGPHLWCDPSQQRWKDLC